jgi:hypothetical protein
MISRSPRQHRESIESRPLAPVIKLRSAPQENSRPSRKISQFKEDLKTPLFYDKPIFRTKKYDLL